MLILKQPVYRVFVRLVAILITACFLWQDIVFALGGVPQWSSAHPKEPLSNTQASPRSIQVPKTLGTSRAVELYQDGGDETIINIEDAHDSVGAQKAISGILGSLVKNYDLNLIGLEGSRGDLDTAILDAFPNKEVQQGAAETLLRETKISAGEFFKIVSGQNVQLYGIEDLDLYGRNVRAYKNIEVRRDALNREMTRLHGAFKAMGHRVFSDELNQLNQISFHHLQGEVEFGAYWARVETLLKANNLPIPDSENLKKLIEVNRLDKEIDFKKARSERDELMEVIKQFFTERELEQFMIRVMEFNLGWVTPGEFYLLLSNLAQGFGIPAAKYPHLAAYVRYVVLLEDVDLIAFFDETDRLEENLREVLIRSDEEARLGRYLKTLEVMARLLDMRLTSKEDRFYRSHRELFNTADIRKYFERMWSLYGDGADPQIDFKLIDETLPEAENFYDLARRRNAALIQNLIHEMRSKKQKIAALVSGGFHTEGLSHLMREDRISHIVIMPSFDDKEGQRPYLTLITRKGSFIDQEEKKAVQKEMIALVFAHALRNGIGFEKIKETYARSYREAKEKEGVDFGRTFPKIPITNPAPEPASSDTGRITVDGRPYQNVAIQSTLMGSNPLEIYGWITTARRLTGRLFIGGMSFKPVYQAKTQSVTVQGRPATPSEIRHLSLVEDIPRPEPIGSRFAKHVSDKQKVKMLEWRWNQDRDKFKTEELPAFVIYLLYGYGVPEGERRAFADQARRDGVFPKFVDLSPELVEKIQDSEVRLVKGRPRAKSAVAKRILLLDQYWRSSVRARWNRDDIDIDEMLAIPEHELAEGKVLPLQITFKRASASPSADGDVGTAVLDEDAPESESGKDTVAVTSEASDTAVGDSLREARDAAMRLKQTLQDKRQALSKKDAVQHLNDGIRALHIDRGEAALVKDATEFFNTWKTQIHDLNVREEVITILKRLRLRAKRFEAITRRLDLLPIDSVQAYDEAAGELIDEVRHDLERRGVLVSFQTLIENRRLALFSKEQRTHELERRIRLIPMHRGVVHFDRERDLFRETYIGEARRLDYEFEIENLLDVRRAGTAYATQVTREVLDLPKTDIRGYDQAAHKLWGRHRERMSALGLAKRLSRTIRGQRQKQFTFEDRFVDRVRAMPADDIIGFDEKTDDLVGRYRGTLEKNSLLQRVESGIREERRIRFTAQDRYDRDFRLLPTANLSDYDRRARALLDEAREELVNPDNIRHIEDKIRKKRRKAEQRLRQHVTRAAESAKRVLSLLQASVTGARSQIIRELERIADAIIRLELLDEETIRTQLPDIEAGLQTLAEEEDVLGDPDILQAVNVLRENLRAIAESLGIGLEASRETNSPPPSMTQDGLIPSRPIGASREELVPYLRRLLGSLRDFDSNVLLPEGLNEAIGAYESALFRIWNNGLGPEIDADLLTEFRRTRRELKALLERSVGEDQLSPEWNMTVGNFLEAHAALEQSFEVMSPASPSSPPSSETPDRSLDRKKLVNRTIWTFAAAVLYGNFLPVTISLTLSPHIFLPLSFILMAIALWYFAVTVYQIYSLIWSYRGMTPPAAPSHRRRLGLLRLVTSTYILPPALIIAFFLIFGDRFRDSFEGLETPDFAEERTDPKDLTTWLTATKGSHLPAFMLEAPGWIPLDDQLEAVKAEELRRWMMWEAAAHRDFDFAEIPDMPLDIHGIPIQVSARPGAPPGLVYTDGTEIPVHMHKRDRFGHFLIPERKAAAGTGFAVLRLHKGYHPVTGRPLYLTAAGEALHDVNGQSFNGPKLWNKSDLELGYRDPVNPRTSAVHPLTGHGLDRADLILVNEHTGNPVMALERTVHTGLATARRLAETLKRRIEIMRLRIRGDVAAIEYTEDFSIASVYKPDADLPDLNYYLVNEATGEEVRYNPRDPRLDPATNPDVIRNRATNNEVVFTFDHDPRLEKTAADAGRARENFLAGHSLDTHLMEGERRPVVPPRVEDRRRDPDALPVRAISQEPALVYAILVTVVGKMPAEVRVFRTRDWGRGPNSPFNVLTRLGVDGIVIEQLAANRMSDYRIPGTNTYFVTNDSPLFQETFLDAYQAAGQMGPYAIWLDRNGTIAQVYAGPLDPNLGPALARRKDPDCDAANCIGAAILDGAGRDNGWVVWKHLGVETDPRGRLVKSYDNPRELLNRLDKHNLEYLLWDGRRVGWTEIEEHETVLEIRDPDTDTRIRTGREWQRLHFVMDQSVRLERMTRRDQIPERVLIPEVIVTARSLTRFLNRPEAGDAMTRWLEARQGIAGLNTYVDWWKRMYEALDEWDGRLTDDQKTELKRLVKLSDLKGIARSDIEAAIDGRRFDLGTKNRMKADILKSDFNVYLQSLLIWVIDGGEIRPQQKQALLQACFAEAKNAMGTGTYYLPHEGRFVFMTVLQWSSVQMQERRLEELSDLSRAAVRDDLYIYGGWIRVKGGDTELEIHFLKRYLKELAAEAEDLDRKTLNRRLKILRNRIRILTEDLKRLRPAKDTEPYVEAVLHDPDEASSDVRRLSPRHLPYIRGLVAELRRAKALLDEAEAEDPENAELVDLRRMDWRLVRDKLEFSLEAHSLVREQNRYVIFYPPDTAEDRGALLERRRDEDKAYFERWLLAMENGGVVTNPHDRVHRRVVLVTEDPDVVDEAMKYRERTLSEKKRLLAQAQRRRDDAGIRRLSGDIQDIEENNVIDHVGEDGRPLLVLIEHGMHAAEEAIKSKEEDVDPVLSLRTGTSTGSVTIVPDNEDLPVRIETDRAEVDRHIREWEEIREDLRQAYEKAKEDHARALRGRNRAAESAASLEIDRLKPMYQDALYGVYNHHRNTLIIDTGYLEAAMEVRRLTRLKELLKPGEVLMRAMDAGGIPTGVWVIRHEATGQVMRSFEPLPPDERGRVRQEVVEYQTGQVYVETLDSVDLSVDGKLVREMRTVQKEATVYAPGTHDEPIIENVHLTTFVHAADGVTITEARTRDRDGRIVNVSTARKNPDGTPVTVDWRGLKLNLYDVVLGDPAEDDPDNPLERRLVAMDSSGTTWITFYPHTGEAAIRLNPLHTAIHPFTVHPLSHAIRISETQAGIVRATGQWLNGGQIYERLDTAGVVKQAYVLDSSGRKVAQFGQDRDWGHVCEFISSFKDEAGTVIAQTHPYVRTADGIYRVDTDTVVYISTKTTGGLTAVYRPEHIGNPKKATLIVDHLGRTRIRRTIPDNGHVYETRLNYKGTSLKPDASELFRVESDGTEASIWKIKYGEPVPLSFVIRDFLGLEADDPVELPEDILDRLAEHNIDLDARLVSSKTHTDHGATWTDYYYPDDPLERKIVTRINGNLVVSTDWDSHGDTVTGYSLTHDGQIDARSDYAGTAPLQNLLDELPKTGAGDLAREEIARAMEALGLGPGSLIKLVRKTRYDRRTLEDGTLRYSDPKIPDQQATLQYRFPDDPRGANLASVYPNGNVEINRWWLTSDAPEGIVPASFLVTGEGPDREVESIEFQEEVTYPDGTMIWSIDGGEKHEVIKFGSESERRLHAEDHNPEPVTGFAYSVKDPSRPGMPAKRVEIYSANGRLLAKEEPYKLEEPAPGINRRSVGGTLRTLYSLSSPEPRPVAAFKVEDGSLRREWLKVDYAVDDKGRQIENHRVRIGYPIKHERKYEEEYQIVAGLQMPSQVDRVEIIDDEGGLSWQSKWLLAILGLVFLGAPFIIFLGVKLGDRIRRSSVFTRPNSGARLSTADYDAAVIQIENFETLGFPEGPDPRIRSVSDTKEKLLRNLQNAQAQNSTSSIIRRRFTDYRIWLNTVFRRMDHPYAEGAYRQEVDRELKLEDMFLMELIFRHAGQLRHSPSFLNWLFFTARQERERLRAAGIADADIDLYGIPPAGDTRFSIYRELQRIDIILSTHTLTWGERAKFNRPFISERFLSDHDVNEQYRLPNDFLTPLIFGTLKADIDAYADLLLHLVHEPRRRIPANDPERGSVLDLIRLTSHDEANSGRTYLEAFQNEVDGFLLNLPASNKLQHLQSRIDNIHHIDRSGGIPFRKTFADKRGGKFGYRGWLSIISNYWHTRITPYIYSAYAILALGMFEIRDRFLEPLLGDWVQRWALDFWWFLLMPVVALWVMTGHVLAERWLSVPGEKPVVPYAGLEASYQMHWKNRLFRAWNVTFAWTLKLVFWGFIVSQLWEPTQTYMEASGELSKWGHVLLSGPAYNFVLIVNLWAPFLVFYFLDVGSAFHFFQTYFIWKESWKTRWFYIKDRMGFRREMSRSVDAEAEAQQAALNAAAYDDEWAQTQRGIHAAIDRLRRFISGTRLSTPVRQRLNDLMNRAAGGPTLTQSRQIRRELSDLLRDEDLYELEDTTFEEFIKAVKNLRVQVERLEWHHRRPPAEDAAFAEKGKYIFFNNLLFSDNKHEDFLRRDIAWAWLWNEIVGHMRSERIIGDSERDGLLYTIEGRVDGDPLSGMITGRPDETLTVANKEAQRRLNVFLSSMHNREMESIPAWEQMRSGAIATPTLMEEIMNSFEDLDEVTNTGRSGLSNTVRWHRSEWLDLVASMENDPDLNIAYGDDVSQVLRRYRDGQSLIRGVILNDGEPDARLVRISDPLIRNRIRYWASLRFQEVSRTLRGYNNIREAYVLLARINLAARRRTDVTEHEVQLMVNRKFRFLYGLQYYGNPEFQNPDGAHHNKLLDLHRLQERYPWIEISYMYEESVPDGSSHWFSVHLQKEADINPLLETLVNEGLTPGYTAADLRILVENHAVLSTPHQMTRPVTIDDLTGEEVLRILVNQGAIPACADSTCAMDALRGRYENARQTDPHPDRNPLLQVITNPQRREVIWDDTFDVFFQALTSGDNVEQRVELPGAHSPIRLQGKPSHQNNLLLWLDGVEVIHTIDMNMDFAFEEALKITFIHDQVRGKTVVVGFAEHIATINNFIWGKAFAHVDRSFNFIQFVHAKKGIRTHYGHPDAHARFYVVQYGGISKPVELTEDVLYGKWALALGFVIKFFTAVTAYKGRDISFYNVLTLLRKFATGAPEQQSGRIDYHMERSPLFGWSRAHIDSYEGAGHFTNSVAVVLAAAIVVAIVVLWGVSGYVAVYDEFFFGAFGVFLSQTIGLIFWFSILLEVGFLAGLPILLVIYPFVLAIFLPMLHSDAVGVQQGAQGRAKYPATGRGQDDTHKRLFKPPQADGSEDRQTIYANYRANLFRLAAILTVLSIAAFLLHFNISIIFSAVYLIMNILVFLTALYIANHLSTPLSGIRRSGKLLFGDGSSVLKIRLRWRQFMFTSSSPSVPRTGKLLTYEDLTATERAEFVLDHPDLLIDTLARIGATPGRDGNVLRQELGQFLDVDNYRPETLIQALLLRGRLTAVNRSDLIEQIANYLTSTTPDPVDQSLKQSITRRVNTDLDLVTGDIEMWLLTLLYGLKGKIPKEVNKRPFGLGAAAYLGMIFAVGLLVFPFIVAGWVVLSPLRLVRKMSTPRLETGLIDPSGEPVYVKAGSRITELFSELLVPVLLSAGLFTAFLLCLRMIRERLYYIPGKNQRAADDASDTRPGNHPVDGQLNRRLIDQVLNELLYDFDSLADGDAFKNLIESRYPDIQEQYGRPFTIEFVMLALGNLPLDRRPKTKDQLKEAHRRIQTLSKIWGIKKEDDVLADLSAEFRAGYWNKLKERYRDRLQELPEGFPPLSDGFTPEEKQLILNRDRILMRFDGRHPSTVTDGELDEAMRDLEPLNDLLQRVLVFLDSERRTRYEELRGMSDWRRRLRGDIQKEIYALNTQDRNQFDREAEALLATFDQAALRESGAFYQVEERIGLRRSEVFGSRLAVFVINTGGRARSEIVKDLEVVRQVSQRHHKSFKVILVGGDDPKIVGQRYEHMTGQDRSLGEILKEQTPSDGIGILLDRTDLNQLNLRFQIHQAFESARIESYTRMIYRMLENAHGRFEEVDTVLKADTLLRLIRILPEDPILNNAVTQIPDLSPMTLEHMAALKRFSVDEETGADYTVITGERVRDLNAADDATREIVITDTALGQMQIPLALQIQHSRLQLGLSRDQLRITVLSANQDAAHETRLQDRIKEEQGLFNVRVLPWAKPGPIQPSDLLQVLVETYGVPILPENLHVIGGQTVNARGQIQSEVEFDDPAREAERIHLLTSDGPYTETIGNINANTVLVEIPKDQPAAWAVISLFRLGRRGIKVLLKPQKINWSELQRTIQKMRRTILQAA